jgi:hypothetical protein
MSKIYPNRDIAETVRQRLEKGKGTVYTLVDADGGFMVLSKKDAEHQAAMKEQAEATPYQKFTQQMDDNIPVMALPNTLIKAGDAMPGWLKAELTSKKEDYDDKKPVKTVGYGDIYAGSQEKAEVVCAVMMAAYPWLKVEYDKNLAEQTYMFSFMHGGNHKVLSIPYNAFEHNKVDQIVKQITKYLPASMLGLSSQQPKTDALTFGYKHVTQAKPKSKLLAMSPAEEKAVIDEIESKAKVFKIGDDGNITLGDGTKLSDKIKKSIEKHAKEPFSVGLDTGDEEVAKAVVEGYLANKNGLGHVLPDDHPYKAGIDPGGEEASYVIQTNPDGSFGWKKVNK